MTFPVTDFQLVARIREAATQLQVRASLDAGRADDSDVSDMLEQFANQLDDLMADSLHLAEQALKRIETEQERDPKARREFMPAEPATGGGAP